MLDQNLTTLLSTLLGGFLTVGGGFIANLYIQMSNDKQNSIKEIKEVLEKLYLTTDKFANTFSFNIVECISSIDTDTAEERIKKAKDLLFSTGLDLDQIRMMVALHVPFLKKDLTLYIDSVKSQTNELYFAVARNYDVQKRQDIAHKVYLATTQFQEAISKAAMQKRYS